MSRQQWGHGYWSGYWDGIDRRLSWPRVIGVMHLWRWDLRHNWRYAFRKPSFDGRADHFMVNVLGFTIFLDFTEGK